MFVPNDGSMNGFAEFTFVPFIITPKVVPQPVLSKIVCDWEEEFLNAQNHVAWKPHNQCTHLTQTIYIQLRFATVIANHPTTPILGQITYSILHCDSIWISIEE